MCERLTFRVCVCMCVVGTFDFIEFSFFKLSQICRIFHVYVCVYGLLCFEDRSFFSKTS